MSMLPPRFREDAFRRYELYIIAAVSAWPQVITANPKDLGLSSTTFACRFRDAMRSLADNHWATTVDKDKFYDIHHKIVVAERAGLVLIGSAETVKVQHEVLQPIGSSAPSEPFDISLPPNATLLLGELAHNRLLACPLRVKGLTAMDADYLINNYDVVVEKNDDGSYTII